MSNSSPLSRRRMLRQALRASAGAGLGLLLPGLQGCATGPVFRGVPGPRPPERWALLSDCHISHHPGASSHGVNMASHLRTAVGDVLESGPPAGVIVNGDCAYLTGDSGDYSLFHDLITHPMDRSATPLHLCLGNHDHRGRFLKSVPDARGASPLEGKWVSVVRGRYANFFLLDSLDEGSFIAGRIGREQLNWLASALAANRDKPALVFGHHPVNRDPDVLAGVTGLADGPALWRVLDAHPHVKAYFYGHTHVWNVSRVGHVHLVNLPATGYVFDGAQPSGWVEMWLGREGAKLDLHKLDGHGKDAGRSAVIEWA